MLSVPVYNETGDQVGTEEVDPALLGGEVNAALLKQAIVMYEANKRQGTVAQKTRSEVEGSTTKLYRQKGTGRARMGNVRTPVRVGGGNAFPRKPREYRKAMPAKMRRLARNHAILTRLQDESCVIIDGLKFDEPKTKRIATLLRKIQADQGCVLATKGVDRTIFLSARNLPKTEIRDVADLNAYDIMRRRRLVFTRDAFEQLREMVGNVPAGAKVGS